jgi:hypothetical protein
MWDDPQWVMERIADELIDNDDYFHMSDPVPFLEWAVDHIGDFTDSEGTDYTAMLEGWWVAQDGWVVPV